jgi:hypothetical protein
MSLPGAEEQIAAAQVDPNSPLAQLIRENQDVEQLQPAEVAAMAAEEPPPGVAPTEIEVPPWLRIYWRKQHPESDYSPEDPTHGLPKALEQLADWMLTHPTLESEPPPMPVAAPPSLQLEPPPTPAAPHAAGEEVVAVTPVVGSNLRISGAQTTPRSESAIAVDPFNPNRIIAACNAIGASFQAQFYSNNGGASWGQTHLPLVAGDNLHSDPTVDWTSDGTAWATTIGIDIAGNLRMRAYRSGDGGVTWNHDAIFSGAHTQADKQMMWVDHSPSSPFQDRIYVIWHNGRPAFVNHRDGPAGAWQTPIQVSGSETVGTGIGSDIKTNSAGDVFAFWPDTVSRQIFFVKSTDGGASFSSPVAIASTFDAFETIVPAFHQRKALIYVSAGAFRTAEKDLVYAVWMDLSGDAGCTDPPNEPGTNVSSTCKTRIWLTRSTDGGTNWSTPQKINDSAALEDQFSPWLAVDETNGNLVVIYNGTSSGRKQTDVWCQASSDDGATWSDPVKVTMAPTDETVSGSNFGNQYGDYNGLSGHAGAFFPSWTDRRMGGREEIWPARINL